MTSKKLFPLISLYYGPMIISLSGVKEYTLALYVGLQIELYSEFVSKIIGQADFSQLSLLLPAEIKAWTSARCLLPVLTWLLVHDSLLMQVGYAACQFSMSCLL